MGKILGQIATCDFNLNKKATDLDRLFVFADGKELELNGDNGYSVADDRMSLTFLGSTCEAIKGDSAPDIEVIFGCPEGGVK